MSYQFYPRKDDPCPNVGHCPHVGGAAIASYSIAMRLVVVSNVTSSLSRPVKTRYCSVALVHFFAAKQSTCET